MKHLILFCIIFGIPVAAFGQSFVNPDTIYQKGDIILQNTDVYYCPFAPPGDSDTRENLSNESDLFRNPDGASANHGNYVPVIYDTATHTFDTLMNWSPCGTALGQYVTWQRLFQALDKPDGTHSDIIVGSNVVRPDTTYDTLWLDGSYFINRTISNPSGPVTVSKNEDVDFRASGTVEMENGFHVMPGAFFHAYQEPKWDTAVFSDEFDDTAKFRNQWYVYNGHGSDYFGAQCNYDSNVYLDTDYQAHDGHALDIVYRENPPDTCSCDITVSRLLDRCQDSIPTDSAHHPYIFRSLASTGQLRSCPFPYTTTTGRLGGPAYDHAPYGKYEVREKIPRMLHHTNNWGTAPQQLEWDLDERWGDGMESSHPGWGHGFRIGPFNGFFYISGSDTFFICHDAGWGRYHTPLWIMIDNFVYDVNFYNNDTVKAGPVTEAGGGFPSSLLNSTGTYSFYYAWWPWHAADTVTWKITQDSHGTWRIFSAPYQIPSIGDSTPFIKNYQPTALKLRAFINSHGDTVDTVLKCHWRDSLNEPTNKGLVWLDDTMPASWVHNWRERFSYQTTDQYGSGFGYPVPPVRVDGNTATDSVSLAAYSAGPYQYHTYAMEWLPHEVRILYDSVVVRRFPDRLVPPGSPYFDWVGTLARGAALIRPAEFDGDDVVSQPSGVATEELKYFEQYDTTLGHGFWDVHGQHAAHHLLDYVKVWDVPADVKIPPFPQ
ncbi:MAG TPA: hypothetical protein VFH95_08225 [Candidatus Kapabacteria bacterium]|nr:hypothetical protein [Candidatus Kapabacteria bacterium]